MRLAPKRVGQWSAIGDECDSYVQSMPIRAGMIEVASLGRGEPLVLLPGLAGGWRLLLPIARRLSRQHRVMMVGLRSDRGFSAGPGHEQPAKHAAEVLAVLEAMRLERPIVCGLSFGGAVALELAIRQPSLLGGLIVMGAEAKFRGGWACAVFRRVLERFPLPTDSPFVNQFFNLLHGRRPEPGPLPDFIVSRCWETDQGVMVSRLRALESFDVTERLWRIDTPTLVLAGMRDVIVAPENQRSLAEGICGARFQPIEGAGHVGFLTHRDEVARNVRRWVRAQCRSYH